MSGLFQFWSFLEKVWAQPYVRQVLLVTVVVLITKCVAIRTFRWTRSRALKWVGTFDSRLTTDDSLKDSWIASAPASDLERNRIDEQFQQLRRRTKHHLEVMVDFYSWYYVAIIIASSAAAIAAIALFWISKTGWANASPTAVVLFVITTTVAVYYRAFPGMFRQEQNIAENKKLYLEYVALENEVKSYCTTGENTQGQRLSCPEFIHYVDTRMARSNNVALGFDPTKLPTYQDLQTSRGKK
jgi:hypothetical protein